MFRKAEDLISQIVQSRSREMMPMGNGLGSPNMNLPNNGSRMSESLGNSGLPPSIPTVSTPSFTQVCISIILRRRSVEKKLKYFHLRSRYRQ